MALPVLNTPIYELTVPSTKQKVKFRPFLVKEEKSLLIAQQSENQQTMLDTLKTVIASCTFEKVNTDTLALFDIEYIFVQLRAKSVGEISELIFSCLECNDPKAKIKVEIDLTNLQVSFDPAHVKSIDLIDGIGVTMRYPGLDLLDSFKDVDETETGFQLAIQCIDSVYTADNVYSAAEQTKEELEAFVNSLTRTQFEKIQNFFQTMPKLEKTVQFKCPVCGYNHSQTLQGLNGFF
jgi:rubrerythrin